MKRSIMLLIAIVALAVPQVASAQVGFNSLFEKSSNPKAELNQTDQQVAELLKEAGFTITEAYDDGSVYLEIERGGLKFPIAVNKSVSKTHMWIDVILTKIPDNGADHIDKILELMELSGSRGSAFFSYRKEYRMLHIYDSITSEQFDAAHVKAMVDGVIDMALATQPQWNTSTWVQARHIGEWSSPLNQGEMDIVLMSDGRFQLTNRNGESVTEIVGTYQLDGDKLVMVDGQGTKLAAQIRFTDGNHFELSLNGANLEFERV